MNIKKIRMNSFGKFTDRTIDFSSGLNVIFGVNEAGKSTVHSFLRAMLFGIYKQDRKKRSYEDFYLKYVPWYGENYGGSLTFENSDGEYTIRRNLRKADGNVTVTEDATGKDITGQLPYDPVARQADTSSLLGINTSVYDNTVSVSQMGSATKEALSDELSEIILNTSLTNSPGVSYKKALEKLTREKERIGTPTRKSTPRGEAEAKLNALNAEMASTLISKEENAERYKRIEEIGEKIKENDSVRASLSNKRQMVKASEYVSRYNKFKEATSSLQGLNDIMNEPVRVSEGEYRRYGEVKAMMADAKEEYSRTLLEYSDAQKESRVLEEKLAELSQEQMDMRDAAKDAAIFENVTAELTRIKEERESDERAPLIEERYVRADRMKLLCLMISAGLAGISAVMSLGGLVSSNTIWFKYALIGAVLCAVCVGALLYFLFSSRAIKKEYESIVKRTGLEVAYREQLSSFLSKYGASDLMELSDIFERAEYLSNETARLTKEKDKAAQSIEVGLKRAKELETKLRDDGQLLSSILRSARCEDEEALDREYSKIRAKEIAKVRYEEALKAATLQLGDLDEETLAGKAQSAIAAGASADLPEDYVLKLAQEEKETYDEYNRLTEEVSRLKGAIGESESHSRPVSEITEDIASVKAEIDDLERRYRAFSDAQESIVRISEDIKGYISGRFNDYVSELLSAVTGGRYTKVYVSDKLTIQVRDEASDKLVDLKDLSGGTIDQCYFAVRFAAADLIVPDKTIPIILDDCFVQYDEDRLMNIMTLLAKVSDKRQILLFTCRRAETQTLDRLGIPYNYIDLGR